MEYTTIELDRSQASLIQHYKHWLSVHHVPVDHLVLSPTDSFIQSGVGGGIMKYPTTEAREKGRANICCQTQIVSSAKYLPL